MKTTRGRSTRSAQAAQRQGRDTVQDRPDAGAHGGRRRRHPRRDPATGRLPTRGRPGGIARGPRPLAPHSARSSLEEVARAGVTACDRQGIDRLGSSHGQGHPRRRRRARPASDGGGRRDIAPAWLDRDLSWLEFNRRVLHEALDERTPLLERVKFLAIFSSNLDEFFMKRMALDPADGRRREPRRPGAARAARCACGRSIVSMLAQQAACYTRRAAPATRRARRPPRRLGRSHRRAAGGGLGASSTREISPVLTPLSLDAAHPFPYVSNLSTSWAFRLEDPVSGESVLVRVKVPRELPQWLRVRAGVSSPTRVFVGLDQVIAANAQKLFPGMEIESASLFRVCRDAEVERRRRRREQARARRAGAAAAALRARRAPRDPAERRPGDGGRARAAVRAHARGRLRDDARCSTTRRCSRSPGSRSSRCATRRGRRCRRPGSRRRRRHLRRDPRAATSCCTSRTTASTPASSGSSARPPTTR